MATFLELVQAVALESGTVSKSISTVEGQTGRMARFVGWTRDALLDIERRRGDWRWMRRDFAGDVLPGVAEYDAASLGIASFSRWVDRDDNERAFTIQKASEDRGQEGYVRDILWDGDMGFRRTYRMGEPASRTGMPSVVAITPADTLALWPIPDETCILRGEYVRAPQRLVADGDVPQMPAEHHDAIRWRALMLMGLFDQSPEQVPVWAELFGEHMAALERKQTPRVTWGGPLA